VPEVTVIAIEKLFPPLVGERVTTASPALSGVTSRLAPTTVAATTVGPALFTKYGACPPEIEYETFCPTAKVTVAGALTTKLEGLADPTGVPALPPPPPHAVSQSDTITNIKRLNTLVIMSSCGG
jgi:hypothetical protein